jgi:hypothetical protein
MMGADIYNKKDSDAGCPLSSTINFLGLILSDRIVAMMQRMKIPNGLQAIGFEKHHVCDLVKGTLPQHRVIKLSPVAVCAYDPCI